MSENTLLVLFEGAVKKELEKENEKNCWRGYTLGFLVRVYKLWNCKDKSV